jgi:ABC-2 type transport system ATP-binding protein
MSAPAVVEVQSLTKRYGERRAVDRVSFSVAAGEIFGLLGPNGAGKTTTLAMLATLVPPSAGEAWVDGRSVVRERAEVRRRIGLVPQETCLYPALSAEENLLFMGRTYGLGGRRLKERVDSALDLVGLAARRGATVTTFSGGMKRRLNLACGLVHDPRVLLLDEPTVGVDPQSRERIFEGVEALGARGIAIVYTTHYMEEAERLCHRVAILDEGRVIAEGTSAELSRLMGGGQVVLFSLAAPPSAALAAELARRGAAAVRPAAFRLVTESAERVLPDLLQCLSAAHGKLAELAVHRPNLGEVFFHLTGKELRD